MQGNLILDQGEGSHLTPCVFTFQHHTTCLQPQRVSMAVMGLAGVWLRLSLSVRAGLNPVEPLKLLRKMRNMNHYHFKHCLCPALHATGHACRNLSHYHWEHVWCSCVWLYVLGFGRDLNTSEVSCWQHQLYKLNPKPLRLTSWATAKSNSSHHLDHHGKS